MDEGWTFGHGQYAAFSFGNEETRIVNLPHDYMIENDVTQNAPAGPMSGFYTAGVAYYTKKMMVPKEWENENVYLRFDGIMMNATVDVNGGKAALQHYGYSPFCVDITSFLYFGEENRITVTVNPSMQPNSRWYSGAGIFRSVELIHVPKIHIANDGIFGYTKFIEYDGDQNPVCAYLQTAIEIENMTLENHIVRAEVVFIRDDTGEEILRRSQKIEVKAGMSETAYIPMTVDNPSLWDTDSPMLYRIEAVVTDLGEFRTHHVEKMGSTDKASVLFGIRTITVDVRNGLCINGKTVKLKGGCIHHDNGILGAVSLYDAEYRKLSKLKQIGFNAVRTAHNPPSEAMLEAADRLGMYVYDEAFDTWGMAKQPGDYNMFFDSDWEKDLTAFIKRDRSHVSVIMWSVGNEIPERGGLNDGYVRASQIARKAKELDPSRPVSNAGCSYWNGLDDRLMGENLKKIYEQLSGGAASIQNLDGAKEDLSWECYSEGFVNGLDIVGYNYMEDKYVRDHELFPERVIVGSENYPKEIGIHWPMVEKLPYVLGDFTWTAYDYIGEAGIGKTAFVEENDPLRKAGPLGLASFNSAFPWRLANDADVDINGNILPQGCYRSVVFGSDKTYLYSYDPASYGKYEIISKWGFPDVKKNWNYAGSEGKQVKLAIFSRADEVEVLVNGESIGRVLAGSALAAEDLPHSFVFETAYRPGTVVAISYKDGAEVSRDTLETVGEPAEIRLVMEEGWDSDPEHNKMVADGHSLRYVGIEIVDDRGRVVPDARIPLEASVQGAGILAGFGSSNPITAENYTCGKFQTYLGRAMAALRSKYEAGTMTFTVTAEKLPPARMMFDIELNHK